MPKRPCELSYRPVLQHHQAAESAALPAVIRRKEQANPQHERPPFLDQPDQIKLNWMDRNFFKRIELAFPILDPKLKKRVITEDLKFYLADNQQGWAMNGQGNYQRRRSSRSKPHNAQGELMVTLGTS